ncbi:hypothetical protein PS15p_211849 [Mucor circinelloides]
MLADKKAANKPFSVPRRRNVPWKFDHFSQFPFLLFWIVYTCAAFSQGVTGSKLAQFGIHASRNFWICRYYSNERIRI